MKKFIVNCVLFIVFSLLTVLILTTLLALIEKNINADISNHNHIPILGHSHAAFGLNDSILSKSLNKDIINYGRGGQSMFWTIQAARKLKLQGSKIFFLELSNVTYTTDWKTTDESRGFLEVDKIYYLTLSDWKKLLFSAPVFTIKLFSKIQYPSTIISRNNLVGGETFVQKIVGENTSTKPDFNDEIVHDFIKSNRDFLFVIFRAPQHPGFYKSVGDKNETYFVNKFKSFEHYDNCILLDFGHKYKADSLFKDFGHMNNKGKNTFSIFFSDTLKNVSKFNNFNY